MDTNKHMAIVGITGSGKTTFAEWMYKNTTGLAIFFNTQLEYKVEAVSDVVVYNINGFKDAFNKENDGHRIYHKICFNPDEDEDKALEQLHQLITILFRLGYQINKNADTPKVWCHLFIDEIHEFSSQLLKDKIVDRVWKRGRRYGIVGIAISQRPAEVSHSILANCPTHVIFKTGQYELPYYQRYHIPIFKDEDAQRHLQKKYCFIVFYDGKIEKYPPISK
jgi:DNA segregation ATPase FtsK/SpoIIIE-like protein